MTGPLVATYRYRRACGAERYVPTIIWQGGDYECGPALRSASEAIRFACNFAKAIRDCLHSGAFAEHEDRLAL